MRPIIYMALFLLIATTAKAESWNIVGEDVSTTGKTKLNLNRYEMMNPEECRKWVSQGAPPYNLSGETKVVETKVFYSTKFLETDITIVCQGSGKKGNVLMSGPRDNIEALNLPIRKKN